MDTLEKEYYIDASRNYFQFLIKARQWSGFGEKELNDWIENFKSIEDGEYLACKFLNELIAYSENDMILMLKGAISDILHKEIVFPKQIESNFSSLKSDLEYELNNAMKKTLFVPLSVNDAPGESGDAMIRLLTQKSGLQINKQFQFEILKDSVYERIIIIDDCIGSGEQFKDFWEYSEIKDKINFRKWCKEKNIKVYYIVLVGYIDTIKELQQMYDDVQFMCVEKLNKSHNVIENLNKDEIFFKEREHLENYLENINISMSGFNDLKFAIIIHNNIPDWTLPIFHKCRQEWEPLLRRKDSDA